MHLQLRRQHDRDASAHSECLRGLGPIGASARPGGELPTFTPLRAPYEPFGPRALSTLAGAAELGRGRVVLHATRLGHGSSAGGAIFRPAMCRAFLGHDRSRGKQEERWLVESRSSCWSRSCAAR